MGGYDLCSIQLQPPALIRPIKRAKLKVDGRKRGDLFNVITLGKVTKEFREPLKFILEHGVCLLWWLHDFSLTLPTLSLYISSSLDIFC